MQETHRRDEGVDRERTDETDETVAQTSVGTPLARQEKKGRRRLFGGRRETRTAGS